MTDATKAVTIDAIDYVYDELMKAKEHAHAVGQELASVKASYKAAYAVSLANQTEGTQKVKEAKAANENAELALAIEEITRHYENAKFFVDIKQLAVERIRLMMRVEELEEREERINHDR